MADKFTNYAQSLTGPATYARSLTASDTADLTDIPRWLTATTGGVIRVDMLDNDTADNPVDVPVNDGQIVFIRASRVYATGTTATGIVGYW